MGKKLALKGGTAINLAILDLPRLSVDIDLDYTENVRCDEMIEIRSIINQRISRYMFANDYILSVKTRRHHALDSLIFEYTNTGGVKDNIKIEINYMLRCHILQPEQRRIVLPFLNDQVSVLCVDPIEIFASKIVALLNRAAPRDLFDVYQLTRFLNLNETELALLRKCVIFYGAIGTKSLRFPFQLSNIDGITQNRIKTDLLPVLRRREKFDLTSSHIQVKRWLSELLIQDENGEEFLKSFENMDYRPEILFGSYEMSKRIQNHPMALWKCSRD